VLSGWLLERPYAPERPSQAAVDPRLPEQWPEPAAETFSEQLPVAAPQSAASAPPRIDEPNAIAAPRKIRPKLDTDNVLLLGIDRHGGYKRGGSTDTIVVAAFDRKGDHLGLIGIPRDLYVTLEREEQSVQTRINAVYGMARQRREDPLRAVERVIEDTLGLPISHSVAIDLQVFETAIDAVGGIDVDVDCPILDNFLDGRVEGGRRALSIEAGPQHLDGVTAAMFVRSRHGRSDFGRARRQQAVLLGLRRKLLTVDGASELPALFDAVEGSIETHMSRLELLRLARRVLNVEPGHLHGIVLGHAETTGFRTERNWSVLLPNSDVIERTLDGLFEAPKPGEPPLGAVCPAKDIALEHRVR
jgi:polyisoprenyl-teichoic acid--peptidoglycan teichoic acid transferase